MQLGEIGFQGLLAQELVRQAFLLSARDEAGLITRDAWLGDAMPEDGPIEPFALNCLSGQPNFIELSLGFSPARKRAAILELRLDGKSGYKELVVKVEELSRGKFLTTLQKCGYVISPQKNPSDAKLPAEIEKLLGEMNFISQFSAVRQLHELILTQGESPALQGALVRGYANLGHLTEYNWHPAFKVFYARSMLYAQRMVAQGTHPRWAKWHRAYAFALSGLQKWALNDLEDAEKEAQSSATEKETDAYAKPAWVDIVNAFCRYDTKSLNPDWDHAENAELTGLLQSTANELAMNGDLIVAKALEILEKSPECYRLYNVVCRFGGVIVGHPGTTVSLQVFRDRAYQRLAKIPGMPEDVAKIIRKRSSGDRLLDKLFGPRGNNPAGEFLVRRELIAALFTAGKTTKVEQTTTNQSAAIADNGEPSWATLGLLIRELSFVQAWRRIYFEAKMLGIAPDDTLKEFKPLYADHPYGDYLDIYSWDDNVKNKAVEKVQSIQMDGVMLQSFPLFEEFKRSAFELVQKLVYTATTHVDCTNDDLIRSLVCRTRSEKIQPEIYKSYAHSINDISPGSPFAGSLLIENDWDYASKELQKWEEIAASHPGLMRSIAQRYYKDNHIEDSIRCLKTAISVSPDKDSFEMLANMYYEKGDKKKYVATLEEYLKHPDYHLTHGKFCEKIAYHYMSDRKWHKALPYAERAAETYSAWGLRCLANCYEALQDWKKAEELHKAAALRYRNSATTWYFFCKRTGAGDVETARQTALDHIEQPEATDLFSAGYFWLLEKQPEKAITYLRRSKSPWDKFLLLAAADQANDSETFDATLKSILEIGENNANNQDTNLSKDMIGLASLFANDRADKVSKIDVTAATELINTSEPVTQLIFTYYLAKYLDTHGRESDAVLLWKKCLGYWIPMDKFARTMAAVELREHNVPDDELEALLPKENTEEDKPEGDDSTEKIEVP